MTRSPTNALGYVIRHELPSDVAAVHAVVEQAFKSPVEAELVRWIRESSNYVQELSLVAVKGSEIIGHVMLSYTELHDGELRHRVLTLSPVSVVPHSQCNGVGSSLIAAVLRRADQRGEPLVILEGSPDFYGRLGFEDSRDSGIYFDLPDWAPPTAGRVYKLSRYERSIRGRVVYQPALCGRRGIESPPIRGRLSSRRRPR